MYSLINYIYTYVYHFWKVHDFCIYMSEYLTTMICAIISYPFTIGVLYQFMKKLICMIKKKSFDFSFGEIDMLCSNT